jgi:hypothetical protein
MVLAQHARLIEMSIQLLGEERSSFINEEKP